MKRFLGSVAVASLILSGCGGGGGGSGGGTSNPPIGAVPAPTPSPSPSATCSLSARQEWAGAQIREWYLFPETLPASINASAYATINDYVDALTATARSQRRDRYFTYVTSIAQENAFYASGASAGFGIRLHTDVGARRVFVAEAFEGAPALAAGLDRGTEILAIGNDAATLQTIEQIITARGDSGVIDALGASTVGLTRTFRIRDAAGERTVTVSKAEYSIAAVSPRYGAKVIDDGGRKVGYINLRTFISNADPALRQAFAGFKAQGITNVIIDFRYNGGGLVSIAELMGDLLGGNRTTSEVFSFTTFRPSKSAENEQRNFQPKAESIAPTKIAFIGTDGSASASELVINAFIPYLRANAALIGTNTYGKPVGQIALDRAACDDRLRVVAFKTENAARQGEYYDGLARVVEASCQAGDDVGRQLGDPQEASTKAALDFIAGRSCTRIASGQSGQSVRSQRELLQPERPTDTAQREVPGVF